MRRSLLSLSVMAALTAAMPSQAKIESHWGDINLNYLDWSQKQQKDFFYVELEGGADFSWGELYGFLDFENHDDEISSASKGIMTYRIKRSGLRLYGQSYSAAGQGFHTRNTVLGTSYHFTQKYWFINPFVGVHYTNTSGFAGLNGGMAGWSAGYNFNIANNRFSLTSWHETEFLRTDDYIDHTGETDGLSMNGAFAFWWHATPKITAGVQYRYANNKLGTDRSLSGTILTLKYNL